MYYGSLTESEQSDIDSALAQGRRNDLTDMADAFLSEIEEEPYEPSDIIKQYDKQFDEAVAAYNKKVEDFKEKEDKRIAGMFQYDKPIGPQAMQGPKPMQGPKAPPVQGPKKASKDDEPWESEVQDQLGTKLDNILEQIRNEPLPQPSKTKRRKSKGKKKLSRKSYTAQELGVGESLNLILENVIETRESLFKLYKLEKERFEFKKKIDKKLTQQLAAKKRERNLERNKKKEETFLQKKIKSAKTSIKQGLLDALISGAILFALPLIIEGIKGLLPGQRNNKPPSDPNAGSPTSAADQSGGLGQPDVPPGAVPIPVEEYKESDKTESESKPNTTAEPITPTKEPLINRETDPASFTPFRPNDLGGYQTPSSSFNPFSFKTGGPVPGPKVNKDVIPAMLTPGEFVMSKGAVNKFGLNVMMSMNKAGGGTNRPTYSGMVPGFNGGGFAQRTAELLENYEGLRTNAYPDPYTGGEPYTIGIGATYYPPGFRLEGPVRLGDTITKKEAYQIKKYDIDRHTKIAISEVGADNWSKIPENVKVALVSKAFNYGSLGGTLRDLVKTAVSTNNYAPVAADFRNRLASHNNGINSWRRNDEASIIEGGVSPRSNIDFRSPEPVKLEEPPTPAFNAPGSEVRGYQGPPTPGSLRSFSGVGNIMEDLNFNLQVLGAERRTRSATRSQPPEAHPRRRMNALQQILQIFSPTTPPEPPEFIAPTNTRPVGRRSPQQAGS